MCGLRALNAAAGSAHSTPECAIGLAERICKRSRQRPYRRPRALVPANPNSLKRPCTLARHAPEDPSLWARTLVGVFARDRCYVPPEG